MDLHAKITEALESCRSLIPAHQANAVMGVIEARLNELETKACEDTSGDPWDHGYHQALKDMRGAQ